MSPSRQSYVNFDLEMQVAAADDKRAVCLGWLTYLSGEHTRGGASLCPHLSSTAMAIISTAKL
jgi:hypothetical protein